MRRFAIAFVVLLFVAALPGAAQGEPQYTHLGVIRGAEVFATPKGTVNYRDPMGRLTFALEKFEVVKTANARVELWDGVAADFGDRPTFGPARFMTTRVEGRDFTHGYASVRGGLLEFHPSGAVTHITLAEIAEHFGGDVAHGPQGDSGHESRIKAMTAEMEAMVGDPLTTETATPGPVVIDLALPYSNDSIKHWATGSRAAVLALQNSAAAFFQKAFERNGLTPYVRVNVVGTTMKVAWNPNDARLKRSDCLTGPCGQVAREAGLRVRNKTGADLVLSLVGSTGVKDASAGFADMYTGHREQAYGVLSVASFPMILHESGHFWGPNANHNQGFLQCGDPKNPPPNPFATAWFGKGTLDSLQQGAAFCSGTFVPDLIGGKINGKGVRHEGLPTWDKTHNALGELLPHLPIVAKFR